MAIMYEVLEKLMDSEEYKIEFRYDVEHLSNRMGLVHDMIEATKTAGRDRIGNVPVMVLESQYTAMQTYWEYLTMRAQEYEQILLGKQEEEKCLKESQ